MNAVFKRIGIVLLWLCITLLPVQAQSSLWTAWLFNQTAGTMTLVNDAGVALDTLALPTVQNYVTFSDRVAVSPDGRYMAYTLTDDATFNTAGLLYDREANVMQTLYPSGSEQVGYSSLWRAASSHLFTEAGFATGYSVRGGGWRLLVQLYGGGIVSLDSNNAVVVTLGLSAQDGITPVVQYFTGTTVTFTLTLTGADSTAPLQTYVWDYLSGTIQSFAGTPLSDMDVLPTTGEIISASLDANFPNHAQDFTLFQQANTLHIYVPQTATRFPVYSDAALSLYQPRFVENGRRVLVGGFDEYSGSGEWRLLERSGQPAQPVTVLRAPDDFVTEALGVFDGFVYITSVLATDGTTTLMHVDTRQGLNSGRLVWIGPAAAPLRLVWVHDTRTQAEQYGAWGQLAGGQGEIISPLALPTLPVAGPALAAGSTALINTTEGDQLNVRSGPGRDYGIVTRLDDGTRVTIIDGPRTADGLIWWQIRAGDLEGWVIESIEDGGALIQTLIPG
ncbi:MAG: SH3 domain-containing protein [Anaerolineae bacterium]